MVWSVRVPTPSPLGKFPSLARLNPRAISGTYESYYRARQPAHEGVRSSPVSPVLFAFRWFLLQLTVRHERQSLACEDCKGKERCVSSVFNNICQIDKRRGVGRRLYNLLGLFTRFPRLLPTLSRVDH